MKRAVVCTTGLVFLLSGPIGAYVVQPDDHFANEAAANIAADGSIRFVEPGVAAARARWFDANENLGQNTESQLQLKENSNLVEPSRDDSGLTRDFSVSEPVTSSSGPAPTEAPMPRAGWIGLAGVLGVMAARWFSASRRSRGKSAAG
jgi:hypothetical protein